MSLREDFALSVSSWLLAEPLAQNKGSLMAFSKSQPIVLMISLIPWNFQKQGDDVPILQKRNQAWRSLPSHSVSGLVW